MSLRSESGILVGVNAYFLGHPHTGSGQYLSQLVRWLPEVAPDLDLRLYTLAGTAVSPDLGRLVEPVEVPRGLAGNWAKLYFEQVAFPRRALGQGCQLLFVPYLGPPILHPDTSVVTVHDTIPLLLPQYRHGALARAYSLLVRANARRARLLLADSRWTMRDTVQLLGAPPGRIRVVSLGVSGDLVPVRDGSEAARVRERYRLPAGYVLYMGGFDRRKRMDVLLAAYRLLAQATPAAPPLVVAGRLPERVGPAVTDVRRLVRESGLEDRVMLVGPLDEADKAAVLSGAMAFVFPSEYEGFGLPPLEAMACGVPVVAANASAVPEVCGEAALLVRPGDAAALAEALGRVVNDADLRRRMSRVARARAAGFSWQATARLTAAALREAHRGDKH
ncbi:MAG: glycosyltransferase family 4 protein [Anaerolineae bacterium]|nr:glycosyltransferase family 4 protein [Anaerolineae bacterium]